MSGRVRSDGGSARRTGSVPVAASALAVCALAACTPGSRFLPAVEIGYVSEGDGAFHPFGPGDVLRVFPALNGAQLGYPSLRVEGIDPNEVDPTVELWVGGVLVAATLSGEPVTVLPDGDGYLLPELRTSFQVEPCCYACREADIRARVVDGRGRTFSGEASAPLVRFECPDAGACCAAADFCPDPSMTLVCQ